MRCPLGILLACLAWIFTCTTTVDAKAKAPDWLVQAAEAKNPEFQPKNRPGVVVLWDEGVYDYREDGTLLSTFRYAIRIVEPSGKSRARAYASYREGSSRISRIKAWSIDRDNNVYAFKNSDIDDVASTSFALYSESRAKICDGESRCQTGSVFGYEYTREEKSVFSQSMWFFQSNVPVLLSRIEISVPEGWNVEGTGFHGAPASTRDGNRYFWQMENLPKIVSEMDAPYRSVNRSFLSIDVRPPEGERTKHSSLRFETWEDVANYTATIQDPQMTASPEIIAKARELTAGSEDVWSKVKAIGDYVKSLRYASINFDLGQGGGYIPRSASEVFEVGYGDCKDKANLLRSMLGVVGIKAYPVVVNASDNDRVYPDWPSPFYFNHCIAAVEVDESVDTHAVVEDKKLGRILFVDATSELTPIGELPFEEQGGLTVIGKMGQDELVRLPQAPPEGNLSGRTMWVELFPNGSILGVVHDTYKGKKADEERRIRLHSDEKEYKAIYERWIGNGNSSAVVRLNSINDNAATDRSFKVQFEFAIPRYAKNMRNQLLIFKPAILSRQEESPYEKRSRTMPLRIAPSMVSEDSVIYLPAGFKVDDMEESVEIETDFARYSATLEQVKDKLLYKRSLKFNDKIVPPEDYSEVQDFYRSVIEADQTPVVLARIDD